MEYAEVNTNFRMLADIRFKLLALVPALGGAANFVLSGFALAEGATAPPHSLVLMIGVMGFLATLGITIYDQRNSELYDKLISRAKYLEQILELREKGQFRERPDRGRYLFWKLPMGHDVGLSIIYGPVLGAWAFPVTYVVYISLQTRLGFGGNPRIVAVVVASLMSIAFTLDLLGQDNSLPWQKDEDIREADVVEYIPSKDSLKFTYYIRDLPHTIEGVMTQACKCTWKKLIANNSITYPTGMKVVIHYWTKKTKTETGKIETLHFITHVMFAGHERRQNRRHNLHK